MLINIFLQFHMCKEVHSKACKNESHKESDCSDIANGGQREKQSLKHLLQSFQSLDHSKEPGDAEDAEDACEGSDICDNAHTRENDEGKVKLIPMTFEVSSEA